MAGDAGIRDLGVLVKDRADAVARHGGDIAGMQDHLDYIADLGATAVWCTPLLLDNQERESYHGYACADYYHIDPRFGDNAAYKAFVDAAHERGLKVIDLTASVLCMENHLPLGVFSLNTPGNIADALNGHIDGTVVTAD